MTFTRTTFLGALTPVEFPVITFCRYPKEIHKESITIVQAARCGFYVARKKLCWKMHSISYLLHNLYSFIIVYTCIYSVPTGSVARQKVQISRQEPGLPSHLPSPKPPSISSSRPRPPTQPFTSGRQGHGNGMDQSIFGRVPALTPPQNGPPILEDGPPPFGEVPFGLNHIVLILVPQVKLKPQKMPKWLSSNLKLSFPITIFFDKLDIPVGARPFPFRGKRDTSTVRLNDTIHGAERAILIPRLEKLLESNGLEGKSCLLRTICEVHEFPLDRTYGFLGQLITLFFSVSRSAFAESILSEYFEAEQIGKSGDCSQYFSACNQSMFSWQEITQRKST